MSLLYGFILGNGLVFIMLCISFLKKCDFSNYREERKVKSKVRGLWKAAIIVLLGEICFQGLSMTERGFASSFTPGTISAFYYAWTLVTVPLSLVVMPVSTVIYPKLANIFGTNPSKGFRLLRTYGGLLFMLGLAVAGAISYFSEWIVNLVFVRGSFDVDDGKITSEILSILIFTLPFACVSRVIRYAIYALSSYMAPTISQASGWLTLFLLGPILMQQYEVLGLAYACAMANIIQIITMFITLRLLVRIKSKERIK
jgi:putative peptidoglycan lipid II flippase